MSCGGSRGREKAKHITRAMIDSRKNELNDTEQGETKRKVFIIDAESDPFNTAK